jgi:hypothetical protein
MYSRSLLRRGTYSTVPVQILSTDSSTPEDQAG